MQTGSSWRIRFGQEVDMGIVKALGEFLFGKNPDIFDENGQVVHKHPKKKWDAWQSKFKTDPQYNWRNHTGTSAGRPQKNSNPHT